MELLVIGINHKTAPVKVRERFSFTRKRLEGSLAELKNSAPFHGAVILSTCNRTEIYAHTAQGAPAVPFIFSIFNAEESDRDYFYILEDADCVRHLFMVASGLDSQVLGETQVLAQVRSAWAIAKDSGATSSLIDRAFERAQEVGGTVRSRTKISQGNISIGSVAIKMLKDRIGPLDGRSALVIGAGEMGVLVSRYLKEEFMKGIFVASRTYGCALEIASICGGKAVDFTKLEEELKDADIVISSTSSPHIILKKEMLVNVMRSRKRPLFIVDLAVPRDVEPGARDIGGVYLYDLDDLKYVVEENYKNRRREAAFAERVVEREAHRFVNSPTQASAIK